MEKGQVMKVTEYTPESPLRHPVRMVVQMWVDMWSSRTLVKRLVVRDISAQYRQTILGYVWAILPPVVTSLIWIILNKSQVVNVGPTDVPYPVFAFTGTMFWQLFMDTLNAPLSQVNANRSLISKVNFPREALLLSGIVQVMFSFGIKLIVLAGILVVYGVGVTWTAALLVLPIFGLMLLGTMVGIFLVPIGFLYKDIQNGLVLLLGMLMYITPVVYPPLESGVMATIMKWNPLTPMFVTIRQVLYSGTAELSGEFIIVVGVGGILAMICWVFYRLALPIIAERMDA